MHSEKTKAFFLLLLQGTSHNVMIPTDANKLRAIRGPLFYIIIFKLFHTLCKTYCDTEYMYGVGEVVTRFCH